MSESSKKRTAVVDTNLFVRGLVFKRGAPFNLLEALRHRRFTLLVSEDLTEEYRTVLSRPRFSEKYGLTAEERADFFFLIERRGQRIAPADSLPVHVRDVKDEKVLAAALGGGADYLVTGDEDLLELRGDPQLGNVHIVTVGELLDVLRK